ncbi:MAG: hypothetical protein GQ553_01525 [Nitrosomonadaceae bacterium]|nr:hypothetical protein [Nitrosomonadaceae bacterium]
MKEAGILDPAIADTVFILKTDTLVLNKDSIITRINLVLDTAKVDSLVDRLIQLKKEGGDTRAVRHEIFKEIIPDMSYSNIDSLKVVIDKTTHYIRFEIKVDLDDDQLKIITKPTSNIPIVTSTAEINIDARKMGRFWKGVQWGSLGTILILVILWFLRGVISTAIKAYIP